MPCIISAPSMGLPVQPVASPSLTLFRRACAAKLIITYNITRRHLQIDNRRRLAGLAGDSWGVHCHLNHLWRPIPIINPQIGSGKAFCSIIPSVEGTERQMVSRESLVRLAAVTFEIFMQFERFLDQSDASYWSQEGHCPSAAPLEPARQYHRPSSAPVYPFRRMGALVEAS